MKKTDIALKWMVNIGFIIISLIALFPILSLLLSSFRPSSELMRNGISLTFDPSTLNLDNYTYIFTEASKYWDRYGNSLIISALTIVLSLFFSSMVGYALALYDFKGKNLFFVFVLFIGAIGLGIWMFIPKRVRPKRLENPYPQLSSPDSDIQDWLKTAEGTPANFQSETTDFHFHNN